VNLCSNLAWFALVLLAVIVTLARNIQNLWHLDIVTQHIGFLFVLLLHPPLIPALGPLKCSDGKDLELKSSRLVFPHMDVEGPH
jgi:hypothetical protein